MNFGHMCFFNDENEYRKVIKWTIARLSDMKLSELRKNGRHKKMRKAK